MLLGDERQTERLGAVIRQFDEVGQHQPDLLDHVRPRIGFDHETMNIIAGSDPDVSFAVPPGLYGNRSAHRANIVSGGASVNRAAAR